MPLWFCCAISDQGFVGAGGGIVDADEGFVDADEGFIDADEGFVDAGGTLPGMSSNGFVVPSPSA